MANTNTFSFEELNTRDKAEAGVEIEINNTAGDPTGMFITIKGTDSSTFQTMQEKFQRAKLKASAKAGRNAIDNAFDSAKQYNLQVTAECTIAWRHATKEMPFPVTDKEQLAEFYQKYPIVYDQVIGAMYDRSLFTQKSPTN